MTKSQIPTNSNSTTGNKKSTSAKSLPIFIVLVAIGVIVLLIPEIVKVLFPNASGQPYKLEKNRTKWESYHITHYRMSLALPPSDSNYNQMPLIVEVKDGIVISVVDAHGKIVSPTLAGDIVYGYPDNLTIPGLFSYTNKIYLEKPLSIDVTYDPILGYPTIIYVDPYAEPCCQEYTIEVKDFQILPP